MRLEPLCELELAFEGELVFVHPYGGHEGAAYGQGTGIVTGERLRGHARWVNHPRVRADNVTLPDLHGVIETDDGARVLFSLTGYSVLVGGGPQRDSIYATTFQADDERYRWLNTLFCISEGAYNTGTQRGEARVFACVNELIEQTGE